MQSKVKYKCIDGLRAYSAVGIILMHVRANADYNIHGFVYDQMVPSFTDFVFLFMMISAFGICCGYYEKVINKEFSIEEFYVRRLSKIWPFFALLCLLDICISPSASAFCEAFADMTLLHGFLPDPSGISVIGVGWFLGVVCIFYFIFPFFCFLIDSKRRAWFSFGIALMFNLLCTGYFHIGRDNFLYNLVFFLAGALIYIYRDVLADISERFRWLLLAVFFILLIIYYKIGAYVPVILGLFSVLLVYSLGHAGGGLDNKIVSFLSSISMEMYLCHMVIFRVLEKAGLLYLFGNGILSYAVTSAVTIAGTVVFIMVLKLCVDKVLRPAVRNIKGSRI